MPVVIPHGETPSLSLLSRIAGQPESYSRKSAYTFGKTLGAGSFGVVRQARNNTTGEAVAVKIMLKSTLKGNEQVVYDELAFLSQMDNIHIVGFRDWFESKTKFYVVTQLATGGELFDRIIEMGSFTEHDAASVIQQVADALAYLHGKNIVHRDIKPENILYLSPGESPIVLADFGIAKQLNQNDELIHSSAGSFGYAAPEVLQNRGHGKPCDIWSLGVITYTLLCGYSPFRSENIPDFLAEVSHNNAVIFHEKYWKNVSEDARRFIVNLLELDPLDRPIISEVLRDPWLSGVHQSVNLLPAIRAGFNAKSKFKQAIELVMLQNRVQRLREMEDDDESDFEVATSSDAGLRTSLGSWSSVSRELKKVDTSSSKESRGDETVSAFQLLVKAAAHNKERVLQHEEKE